MKELLAQLEAWFEKVPSAIVAYSGGVDSSLVAYLARCFLGPNKMIAIVGKSASYKKKDGEFALNFAAEQDIPVRVISTSEIQNTLYATNTPDRCFYCKSTLFAALDKIRDQLEYDAILGGENLDDLGDYRPGIKAVKSFGIKCPLVECRLTKNDVRNLARYLGLSSWDRPASPCLSSRIPYHRKITDKKLKQVELAEDFLNSHGFDIVRVRHYDDTAKIEVPPFQIDKLTEMMQIINKQFQGYGFKTIIVDSEGFVSGKLNRAIQQV